MTENFYKKYTEHHFHPTIYDMIEVVVYERIDRGFDVYLSEEVNSVPELEESRIDQYHIFVGTIDSEDEFEDLYKRKIKNIIGNRYEQITFYKESKSRKICGKIYDELKKAGCSHMSIGSDETGDYSIYIRRKDIEFAECIVQSNLL
ncbi:hypothetical protein EHQ52_17085 [Leptospira koniambonensis]|uniref:Uncharacterized protein n=1 Tax=Leptospira koniambonensis TaxID=2484950 RepID=A0A4R9J4D7_9LEPT|nr:hypothetical protein [Leptospira koniambonensis]TGL31641.1 hypothetical protein EHQ52_17085 [Leptospira koniambonensis]